MTVERALVHARPCTIWNTNFAGMKWDKWDPDVEAVEDVKGDMENGSSLVFVMNDNSGKYKTILSDVVKNERFTFSGSLMGGLLVFKGTFVLTPEGDDKTNVEYSFSMYGLLGGPVGFLKSKAIEGGCEGGLKNVKEFSEAAEAAMSDSLCT
ncbi:hypothetical protein SARC_15323 [Sphaeroforma arctica JP610]|uniref:Uncharacterized protein n=1 Tax=Sphaeroforma arctica JP610 TaxID=667725 RepID=A0A0L0F672_9EUKA|nr:hypothetical protein SARC_15323 [Sphaeroforma arctica JP610]KNC72129.1 hypothetical protein SARC_15323 [Sphaeroforma arctica JP610]|eukprot:XP_014146031.1 hypothetical protein SARC_15323 [Sphaeroforma arctica JP610]